MQVVAIGMLVMSGCAGQRTAQEMNRLKADIGLLDQRVSQLERASLSQPSAGAWPIESQMQPAADTIAPQERKPASPSVKPSKKEIQQALKNAGFYQGPIDGKIGPMTREAIKEFQRVNGLKVDGIVGKYTWEKLAPYADLSAGSGSLSAAEPLK
jgi:murein L,D-transpeptidase YcbB/YkuD